MDNLKNLIKGRRSCRDFTGDTLSREKIYELINDAVWVPSGSNSQPWRFVVITDKSLMKRLSDSAKEDWLRNLDNCPHIRQYEEYLKDTAYNIFYNAPALIIIYGNRESYWRVYDCTMVAYNLHLLAEESGLGCCWIGFAHNIFADPRTMKELGVPENNELVAPLILGHPAGNRTSSENPNSRKPFEINYL